MIRRVILTISLVALTFLVWWKNAPVVTQVTIGDPVAIAELTALCDGDSGLANRLTSRLYPAVKIGRVHGRIGLETLDLFGDDAVYLFEEKPESFADLTKICQLEGNLFSASGGRWAGAVVQWATAGTLPVYLSKVESLTDEDRTILGEVPEALPLLISDTPIANRMLLRFTDRYDLLIVRRKASRGLEGLHIGSQTSKRVCGRMND